jgi:uncharacterized membrane protein YjjB (DUF3815 family)
MGHGVAGVSWQVAVVGALVASAVVGVLARVIARRSGRRERTVVSLSGRD